MREPLRKYAARIQELSGNNGLGLILFGAIAAGTFNSRKHTVRNVVVLERVDLDMLRHLAKDGAKLGKASIAAPLIMTPEYIQTSVDSFPLEFLEIQQRHVCVYGKDFFEELTFQSTHVRLQCERELKAMLIGMRQGLLAAAGREKLFETIETDVAERLIRTLRGLLWLHGQHDPLSASQVITAVEGETKKSLSGIRTAVDEQGAHGWEEFQTLYHDIDALRKFVDAW
jgi:hypothetical protein